MRICFALFALLAASADIAVAQQPEHRLDSVRAKIQSTLRAFYFSLAHQDWEALTADILAAKVVAHRQLLLASTSCRSGDHHAGG